MEIKPFFACMRFRAAVLTAALLFAGPAGAELVDQGTRTSDTSTGLDWLDLTESGGYTYSDVAASGSPFAQAGWRHATTSEVCSLFAAYATEADPCPSTLTFSTPTGSQDNFVDLLGVTGSAFVNGEYTRGLFDDSDSGSDPSVYGFAFASKGNAYATVRIVADEYPSHWTQIGQPLPDSGHFLVRASSPIPEPGSAALLALGLGGLAGRNRAAPGSRRRPLRRESPLRAPDPGSTLPLATRSAAG
jgi:hypothetical protein